MKGEMNDAAGKAWTALSSHDGLTLQELIITTGLSILELYNPMMFWTKNGELKVINITFDSVFGMNTLAKYYIKDRLCPPNTPECATYAEYQRSLRSQRTSKRQSATRSARKNGSAKRGSPRPRKDV
jgi:hypothetical protein